ncbi:hypothetical protein CKQ84_18705 [Shewanella sp. WE21]|uniref:YopT-type cysteine protease domain-containing protein n=1 Tax=Shewanella sp. WE21 TaxID=2029986 RepID=UPI000CF72C8B|nr:YopT-type cysteine protease domain-containing protein [Shewanella sp. WE21]AVI67720.1 hypothetical protein CKQ84_18705 [Shewanella sp. WE21]
MPIQSVRVTSSHSSQRATKGSRETSPASDEKLEIINVTSIKRKEIPFRSPSKNSASDHVKLNQPLEIFRKQASVDLELSRRVQSFSNKELKELASSDLNRSDKTVLKLGAKWQVKPDDNEAEVPFSLWRSHAEGNLPIQLVLEALNDRRAQAKEFIEKGFNELIIEIKKDILPLLQERIEEVRKEREQQDKRYPYLGPDENTLKKIEKFIHKVNSSGSLEAKPKDRGLAYQMARHIETSIKAVDEALKLGQMNGRVGNLSQWSSSSTNEYDNNGTMKQPSIIEGQIQITDYLTLRRMELINELTKSNNRLCSLWEKMDKYDKQVLNSNHFSMPKEIIADIQNHVRTNAKTWRNQFVNVTNKSTSFADTLTTFKHSLSQVSQTVGNKVQKLPSELFNTLKELPQQALIASYVVDHFRDVTYKKILALSPGTISAPSKYSNDEQTVKSIVRSIYWLMQQPAFRMQYDYNPLQAAATNLKKDKPLEAEFAKEVMQDTELEFVDDMVPGNANRQTQAKEDRDQDDEARKSAFSESCDKAIKVSDDILKQVEILPHLIHKLIKSQSNALSSWGKEQLDQELKRINVPESYKSLTDLVGNLKHVVNEKSKFTEEELGEIIQLTRIASFSAKNELDNLDLKVSYLTGKRLDPFSRRAKVAKDWGIIAQEIMPEADIPEIESLRQMLKDNGLLEVVISEDDPHGILFTTRMCQEWEYARKERTILPKTPEEHLAGEKSLVEFVTKWGQKQVGRGAVYAVIEGGVDLATGVTVTLVKAAVTVGVKATIASFTIPYKVRQIIDGMMPGEDYPYKVVQDVVNNRLKQLGFKVAMSFVPRPIKTGVGGAIVMGAYAHNTIVDPKDKIKMDSWLKTLAIETGVTGAIIPVSKVASAAVTELKKVKAGIDLKDYLNKTQIPEYKEKLVQAYDEYSDGLRKQFVAMKIQFRADMKGKLPEEVVNEIIATQEMAFTEDLIEMQAKFRQKMSASFEETMQNWQNQGLVKEWEPLFTDEASNGSVKCGSLDSDTGNVDTEAAGPNYEGIKLVGSKEYRAEVRAHLKTLQQTEIGRNTLKVMNELGVTIRPRLVGDPLHTGDNGQKYYANFASPLTKTIYFDPWNTLSASSTNELADRPWLKRNPAISLFHEVQHISLHNDPAIIDAHGEVFVLRGDGDLMNEHLVSGVDYTDALEDTYYFSNPEWVEQHVSRASETQGFITENDYRRAFYDYRNEEPVLREAYWSGLNIRSDEDEVTDEDVKLAQFARHAAPKEVMLDIRARRRAAANKFYTRFNGDVKRVKVKFYEQIRSVNNTDGRLEFLGKKLKSIEGMAEQAKGDEQSAFFTEVISLLKQARNSNDSSGVLRVFCPQLTEVDAEILDNVSSSGYLRHPLVRPVVDYHKFLMRCSLELSEEEFSELIENEDFKARQPKNLSSMTLDDEFRHQKRSIIRNMSDKSYRDKLLENSVITQMNAIKGDLRINENNISLKDYERIITEVRARKEASKRPFDKIIHSLSEHAFKSELEAAKHGIRIKNITTEIRKRQSFDEFKMSLLPSENLYVKSNPELDTDTLLSNILQYRKGELETLHSNEEQVEKRYLDSLQDKTLPNGKVYSRAQQIEDIKIHGGLLNYERSVIRSHKMAGFLGDINHPTIAKEYWEQRGILQPENVKYVYRYPELPAANIYTMPGEGDSRKVKVEKLEKVTWDVSYFRLIEQKMGKHYLHSVNSAELGSDDVNWAPEKYSKILEKRATSLIDSMPNKDDREYVRKTLKSASNPPTFTTSSEALPFFIKPKIGPYPLENMLLIQDGDKHTMISLMPPGKVQIFNSSEQIDAFVRNKNNHEFLLSHASLANQMDGSTDRGMESILEDVAANSYVTMNGRKLTVAEKEIFPYSSKKTVHNRMNGLGIFHSLAVSSIGDSRGGYIAKTDLTQALGESYWKGIAGQHTVEITGDYELPEQYKDLEGEALFNKLYDPQAETDMQRLVEGKINEFEAKHFQDYSYHLKATFNRLVASAERDGRLSSDGQALIKDMQNGSHEVEVSLPGLTGKRDDYFPLEGMLLIKKGERHILVSLHSDGALIEFGSKQSLYRFFSNPANSNFILSHMSEYDKQPVLPGGDTPDRTLNDFATHSNRYFGTEFTSVSYAVNKKEVANNLDLNHIPLNDSDNIFDTIGRRNLERLRQDADALLTSHAEWNTTKAFEVVGGVLAVPAFALSVAAIIVSGGAVAPTVIAGVAGAAMVVDAASLGVGIAEGVYLLVEGDSAEDRASGLIPLALAPLDALGLTSSATDAIKALKVLKLTRQTGGAMDDVSGGTKPRFISDNASQPSEDINELSVKIPSDFDNLGETDGLFEVRNTRLKSLEDSAYLAIENNQPQKVLGEIVSFSNRMSNPPLLSEVKRLKRLLDVYFNKFIGRENNLSGNTIGTMSHGDIQAQWLEKIDVPLRNDLTMMPEKITAIRQDFNRLLRKLDVSDNPVLQKVKNALDELPTTRLSRYGDEAAITQHYRVTNANGDIVGTIEVIGTQRSIGLTNTALNEISRTDSGQRLLQGLANRGVKVQVPSMGDVNRVGSDGQVYAKNTAAGTTVSFDPENRILGGDASAIQVSPYLERDSSVGLFYELLHIYNNIYSLRLPKAEGGYLTVGGASSLVEESRIVGVTFKDPNGNTYDFSSPEFVESHLPEGGHYLTENLFRREHAQNKGQRPVYRPYYGNGDQQVNYHPDIREPLVKTRDTLSEHEQRIVNVLEDQLKTNLGKKYDEYTGSDNAELCQAAAADVRTTLRDLGYTNIRNLELGLWITPNSSPNNHYVVVANIQGVDIVIDLTAGQFFNKYGLQGPIVTTKEKWFGMWREALKEKPRTLIKAMEFTGSFDGSPFSPKRFGLTALDYQNDGVVVSSASWYKDNGPQSSARNAGRSSAGDELVSEFETDGLFSRRSNSENLNLEGLRSLKDKLEIIENTMREVPSEPSRLSDNKKSFHQGERDAMSKDYRLLNDYSLKQKHEMLKSRKFPGGRDIDTKTFGALHRKATLELGNVIAERHLTKAVNWAKTAEKSGSEVVEIVPQGEYLKLSEGECRPTSMLMAYAIETGNVHNFALRLKSIGTEDSSLYKLLTEIHGGDTPQAKQFNELIKNMQPNNLDAGVRFNLSKLEERDVFSLECHSVRIDIPGHSMSMTKSGSKYYFFDPNFGVVSFTRFDKMKDFIKGHVTSEKFGYPSFQGNVNVVQLKFEGNDITNLKLNGEEILADVVSKQNSTGMSEMRELAAEGYIPFDGPGAKGTSGAGHDNLGASNRGFVPYDRPGGEKYIYFPVLDHERVSGRLIPLLRDLRAKGKPAITPVFRDQTQVTEFKEVLNKKYGQADYSTLEPELRYLYTVDKTDLSDLDDTSTLYVSGHGQPGSKEIDGQLFSSDTYFVANDLYGMKLPNETTVKVSTCNSAVGNPEFIRVPESLDPEQAYAYATDPSRMGSFEASFAGDLENQLITLSPGRTPGKVYGYLGNITWAKTETVMGKIEKGKLVSASLLNKRAEFFGFSGNKKSVVNFRRSDMMRGRFYDPNPMLGRHGPSDLSTKMPTADVLELHSSASGLEPKVVTATDGSVLIKAQGRVPSKKLYVAAFAKSSWEAKHAVWENSAQGNSVFTTDVLLHPSGASESIEDIVKQMNGGELQQYDEVSGYWGAEPSSFIRIVRHAHWGEGLYEITVETLELQSLIFDDNNLEAVDKNNEALEDPQAIISPSSQSGTTTDNSNLNFKQLQQIFNEKNRSRQWGNWVQSNCSALNPLFEQMADGRSEIFQEYRSEFDTETAGELWASVQSLKSVRENPNSLPEELDMAFNNAVKLLSLALRLRYRP